MRKFLLSGSALLALCLGVRADLVNNPGIIPSTSFHVGNCLQATGENSAGTTATPCGSGSGSGNISGPSSSVVGDIPTWSDASGTGLADSGITAANLPQLGASQSWGGLNTFAVRPIFNGQTPYDTGNLPAALAPYLLSATAATTYETQAAAAATFLKLSGGTITGNVTFESTPTLDGVATGAFQGYHLTTNGVLRWNVGKDTAETGSNAGSDFRIYGYDDTGSLLGAALTIKRSTLAGTFAARPTFAGNLAWDAGNFVPANFLTVANAASTYLTIANAAATYTTPAEVNAALATFLTIANAASTYLTQASASATYATILGVQSAFLRIVDAAATYAPLVSPSLTGTPTAPTPATADNSTKIATTAYVRALGDSRYLPLAGGTVTGPVQFNAMPTVNVAVPPVTDSSLDVATASWVQAVITNRAGNGPFMPANGSGMPYDISWTTQGLFVPSTPMISNNVIMQYEFVRPVTIPVAFSGSRATARATATNTTDILVQSSRYGLMGNLVFTGGATKPDGIWSITATGPFNFQAGDTLTLVTTQSGGSPNITDPTLNGISGTIAGSLP